MQIKDLQIDLSSKKLDRAFGGQLNSPTSTPLKTPTTNTRPDNPVLTMTDPNEPVANGIQFYSGSSDLKSMLAPFKKNLGSLRGFLVS